MLRLGSRESFGRSVGVWKPVQTDLGLQFHRSKAYSDWTYWADVEVIAPKTDKARVVMIGESAAHGFMCEPHVTPASMISQMSADVVDLEVVDLTRNGLDYHRMLETIESSSVLEPDVLVVWAGNNWYAWGAERTPRSRLSVELTEQLTGDLRMGLPATQIAPRLADTMAAQVRRMLDTISSYRTLRGKPVVIVVPEWNVCDWRSVNGRVVIGPDRAVEERWHKLYGEAQLALEGEQDSKAEAIAADMICLKVAGGAAAYEILGECHRRSGRLSTAREWFEKARMALLPLPLFREPCCYAAVQSALSTQAPQYGFHVVDLASCFATILKSPLPDRRLFLDFCHLSYRGINLAAAAIQSVVTRALGGGNSLIAPETRVAETATMTFDCHLSAALFNASQAQAADLVRFHVSVALNVIKHDDIPISRFLDAYELAAPTVLSPAYADFQHPGLRFPVLNRLLLSFPDWASDKSFSSDFWAIVRTMTDGEERLRSDLRYVGSGPGPMELLRRSHRDSSEFLLEELWLRSSPIFRSFVPRAGFTFLSPDRQAYRCKLCYRTKYCTDPGDAVIVEVNGKEVVKLPASRKWVTKYVDIRTEFVKPFANRIELVWPSSGPPAEAALADRLATAAASGESWSSFTVWGEIAVAELTVRPVANECSD